MIFIVKFTPSKQMQNVDGKQKNSVYCEIYLKFHIFKA